jgi:superfamily II DNA or RNA helicase
MKLSNRLIPVKKCWVEHDFYGVGIVLQSMEGVDGPNLKVSWRNKAHSPGIVPLTSVRSGFTVGMEVQHVPITKAESSLGEGHILKTRTLAGAHQVLVEFPELDGSRWLPFERLSWIKGVKHRFVTGDSGDENSPEKFRMKVLAHALEIWNENTGSLSRLDIDPLPHQIHLVHHILASGHLNWLIADDVGLGKTIETGMLLKALEQRGQADRVLLITPAGLTNQWKEELHNKFGLSEFRIYGENFHIDEDREWRMYKHVIGSIDQLKDENHLERLLRADQWDLVIFDEAHRLSRRQYGMKYDASQRFQLANRLRMRTKAMVLLSATPHQGKQDKFQSLLMLLNPDRKKDIETLSLNPEILSEMMIRNNKSDVTDAEGNFIFRGKTTNAIRISRSETSREFDESLQSYLRRGYQAASDLGKEGSAIGFVMTVYRKLAASSAKAIHKALLNRKVRLVNQSEEMAREWEDLAYDERFSGEFDETRHTPGLEFFSGELEQLDALIEESEKVLANDQKLRKFIESLIPRILENNNKEKILIFTEYRSTQKYLETALERAFGSGSVGLINGSMKHHERKAAIAHFEEHGQFLISTEAGGEGINLQRKCHIMINYDLPWNPMRLVQRIGRLYRYGQKKRVVVFNLHSPESMDDQIMDLMYERIEQVVGDLATVGGEFNERLGEDILGEIADLMDIETILEQASSEGISRTRERIEEALGKAREAAGKQRELFEFAAGFNPDEIRDELNITTEHVVAFTAGMFLQLGIEIVERTHKDLVWQIRLPDEVAIELGVRKVRYEITFDRLMAAERAQTVIMDMDNFIFKYLLAKAKTYEFGGLSASFKSDDLASEAIVCGYLRWQSPTGVRQRQELVAFQVESDEIISINSRKFGEYLKRPAVYEKREIDRKRARSIFDDIYKEAENALSNRANQLLLPEGFHPIGSAWCGDS